MKRCGPFHRFNGGTETANAPPKYYMTATSIYIVHDFPTFYILVTISATETLTSLYLRVITSVELYF
jgi:hypothetical protein